MCGGSRPAVRAAMWTGEQSRCRWGARSCAWTPAIQCARTFDAIVGSKRWASSWWKPSSLGRPYHDRGPAQWVCVRACVNRLSHICRNARCPPTTSAPDEAAREEGARRHGGEQRRAERLSAARAGAGRRERPADERPAVEEAATRHGMPQRETPNRRRNRQDAEGVIALAMPTAASPLPWRRRRKPFGLKWL